MGWEADVKFHMCLIYYHYYEGRINLKKCFITDFKCKNISSIILNLEMLALYEILYIYIFYQRSGLSHTRVQLDFQLFSQGRPNSKGWKLGLPDSESGSTGLVLQSS